MSYDIKALSITLFSLMLICLFLLFTVVTGESLAFMHAIDVSDSLFAAFISAFLLYKL